MLMEFGLISLSKFNNSSIFQYKNQILKFKEYCMAFCQENTENLAIQRHQNQTKPKKKQQSRGKGSGFNVTEQPEQKENKDPQNNLQDKLEMSLEKKKPQKVRSGHENEEASVEIIKKVKKVTLKQSNTLNENMDTLMLNKAQSNACLTAKSIDNGPCLRKVKRVPSCASNFQPDKFEETGYSLMKKVQFNDQKLQENEIDRQEMTTEDEKSLNFDEFYRKLTLLKIKEQKQPEESFMHFICGLLRLRKKNVHSKLERRLLSLNKMKIIGGKQQIMMLKYIFNKLTCEQAEIESKDWTKIGFETEKPLKQLQNIGVLTLLQWCNFISSCQQKSLKISNLCIEFSCSLFNFHRLATKLFCQQLQKFNFQAKQWHQYQEYYNNMILMTIAQIETKSKQSIENIEKFMINALARSAKKLEKPGKTISKKPAIK